MINNILNAYEETKRQNRGNFFNLLKRVGIATFIFYIILFICEILMIISLVQDRKENIWYICLIIIISAIVCTVVDRRLKQKSWNENINNYNDRLIMIKEILLKPEFNMYEKNKIKQLIRKYKVDIDNIEKKNTDIKENYNKFLQVYILPLFAFAAGIFSQEITGKEIFEIIFLVIILLFSIKIIMENVWIMKTEIIEGNEIVRKRDFMLMLQDLLDRDFPIDDGDLL